MTSLVERIMREIKRGIKRIGFKWSEKGAEKMTRLILLQLGSTKYIWDNHWAEKMGSVQRSREMSTDPKLFYGRLKSRHGMAPAE